MNSFKLLAMAIGQVEKTYFYKILMLLKVIKLSLLGGGLGALDMGQLYIPKGNNFSSSSNLDKIKNLYCQIYLFHFS